MTQLPLTIQPHSYARLAGLLYLIIAVFGAFSIGYVPSIIVEAQNPTATAANLLANLTVFKLGVVADVVVLLAEVILTAMLFIMFRPVSRGLSLIAAFSRIAMVMVMAVNILLHIMPVVLLNDAEYLSGFSTEQRNDLAMVFFEAHALGINVWQLFFSVHLFALGYLVVKSGLFPKVLGWMMAIGGLGYLMQGLANITFIDVPLLTYLYIALLILVTLGELAFAFWLLIKGMNGEKWQAMARQP